MMCSTDEFKKEIEFCQDFEYLMSDEPYFVDFKVSSGVISTWLYHNLYVPDLLCLLNKIKKLYKECKLEDFGWRTFVVRKPNPPA